MLFRSAHRRPIAFLTLVTLAASLGCARDRLDPATLDPRRVALLPLENRTGDSSFDDVGRVAADWLTHELARAGTVRLASSSAVALALGDAPMPYAKQHLAVARTTHAGVLVTGTVTRFGDSLELRVRIVDARRGNERRAVPPRRAALGDPMRTIDALYAPLLAALARDGLAAPNANVPDAGAPNASAARTPPPRYAAYRAYLRARDRFLVHQDQLRSQPLLAQAIALDPSFGAAYAMLASALVNTNRWASADSLVPKLRALDATMDPDGRSTTRWIVASIAGDDSAALAAQREIVARDSSPESMYIAVQHANRALRPGVAIPLGEAADPAILAAMWVPQVWQLAEAYHQAGRFDAELARLQRGRASFPRSGGIAPREVRALALAGHRDEALALADSLLRADTTANGNDAAGVLASASDLYAHGDSATGARIAATVLAWYDARRGSEPAASAAQRGRANLLLGRAAAAESSFVRASALGGGLDAAAHLAIARLVRTGDRDAARRTLDSLVALDRPYLHGGHLYAAGAIAAHLGDSSRATTLLAEAARQGAGRAAWHYQPILAPLRRDPAFVALVTPQR